VGVVGVLDCGLVVDVLDCELLVLDVIVVVYVVVGFGTNFCTTSHVVR
jgi:hypothetical protein